MAIPTKKMYDRNGKLTFDPNNPEDVRNYKEKEPLIEALKLVQELTDPRTGGGLTGATRIISRVTGAKMAKAKFTQNRANQILELFGRKPITRGRKAVPKAAKKATPTIKEVVETKPTIPTNIPTSGSTVSVNKGFTREEMKAYNQKTGNALQTAKDIVSKNLERVKELKKESETFYQKSVPESIAASNKKITDRAIGAGVIAGVIGAGAGTTYYGMQLSNKDNKKTTTPQKTGPVDLKRITNTKPSNIEGVRTVKGTDGKDYGIVWDNKTQSWDYYRGDKTKKTTETPKPDLKREDVGGGYTPIKDNRGSGTGSGGKTTTGSGTGTTPKSKTRIEFEKAFAEARKQAGGAGGIFEWNGKKYGTALEGETVPKDRVEVGKTTTPVTIKNDYPTAKTDPTLEIAMQQDSIRQQMATKPLPTKPLSSLVFKTTAKAAETQKIRNTMDEQNALRNIIADNRMPLKKKSYGGNLAMLKYMKK